MSGVFQKVPAWARWLISALLASSAIPAHAQPDPSAANVQAAPESSTVVYDTAYFAPLAPVTLEDMIRNIPGGIALLSRLLRDQAGRGFGSDGAPLLINGRRMTGKSNDILTRLARIPATEVDRIELIRGNAEGLDTRSDGLIYNVVLKQGADRSSSNFIETRLNLVRGAPVGPQVLLSHSSRAGGLEYGLSYQYENDPRVVLVLEDVLEPDRTRREFRDFTSDVIEKTHTVTANVGYEFANGDKARLNGLYKDYENEDNRTEDQFLVGPDGGLTFSAVEEAQFRFADREWEVGGDASIGLGRLGGLNALFVLTDRVNDDDLVQTLARGDIRTPLFSQTADFDEREAILRASILTPLGDRHSLEYGGEGAFNTLDTEFSFDGAPLQRAVVREHRYESFLTHNFKISDQVNLQTGVVGEFSTIFQNRDGASNSRSFQFLKPRIELRYDITAADQIRLLAERTVSQLDLNDFVARRNINDDRIDFGNPDLSPEQTWRFSVAFERRLANDRGALKIEAYYERISDYIDKILIGAASSGVGNIGNARRYGVDTEFSTRLGFVDLPGAVLTLQHRYQNMRATDPFTGESRWFSGESPNHLDLDLRHNVGNSKFAYGFNVHHHTIIKRQDVSLREVLRFKRHVEAYGEYNLTPKVKMRFTAFRFLGDRRTADKTFYVGNIADGVVERIDFQDYAIRPEYDVRIQGAF